MIPAAVQLFGRPELHADGGRRYFVANHAHRLLAYLAVRTGWVLRDDVIFLFWPDRVDAVGRRNLRKLLHGARREVAGIETEGDGIRWLVESDVAAWRAALERHDVAGALTLCGGTLLEGLDAGAPTEFVAWLERERDEVRRRIGDSVAARCRELERDAPDAAAELAQAFLATDPLDERAVRCCLRSLATAGRAEDAERVYRAYERRLDAELGVEPDAETRTLIRGLTAAAANAGDGRATPVETTGAASQPPVPWGATAFVGRRAELAQLDERLASALAGEGGVVAVEGEAGVGKTRLMEAFLAGVPDGVQVFAGRCFERELSAPLEPVRTALGASEAGGPVRAAEDVSFEAGGARDRRGAHQALAAELVAAAGRGRAAVLFIDDLQWADSATLEFLAYAGHRAQDERILIVVAHRREDRSALEPWRVRLAERRVIRTVRVGRFDAAQTRTLVAELFEGEAGELDRFAEYVHDESEGNPFYALEYLRWLRDAHVLELDDGRRVAAASWGRIAEVVVPESVRSLIWARYQGFGEEARRALDGAAVIGRSFALEVLEQVTGIEGEALWSTFEPLIGAGLMVPVADGSYAFSHDKLRQTVYDSLGPPARRELHARAARALQAADADDAELAHHFLRAERWPQAYAHLDAAARRAEADSAWEVARGAYARILAIVHRLDDPDRKRFDALMAIERQLEFMGRRPEWIDAIERLTVLAQRVGDPRMRAEAALKRMAMHSVAGDAAGAAQAFAQADALFESLGDAGSRARGYRDVAYLAWMRGDYAEVLDASFEAIAIYRRLGHRRAVAATAENVSHAYRWLGADEEASRWADEAAAAYDALGDPLAEYIRLDMLAWTHMKRGDDAAATIVLERLLPVCLRLDDKHLVVEKHMNLGKIYLASGRYADALGSFEAAARLGAVTGDPRHEGYPLISAGVALEGLGRPAAAAGHYLEAARLLEASYAATAASEDETGQGDALTLHGSVARRRLGRDDEARASFLSAEAIFHRRNDVHRLGLVQMELGALHWAGGDLDAAEAAYRAAYETAGTAGMEERATAALASLGVVYRDLGRLDESIEAGRRAVERAGRGDDRLGEALLLTSLADAYRLAGRIEEARTCQERSLALRRHCGDAAGERATLAALVALDDLVRVGRTDGSAPSA